MKALNSLFPGEKPSLPVSLAVVAAGIAVAFGIVYQESVLSFWALILNANMTMLINGLAGCFG